MKLIISFNGADKSGKSTQAKLFKIINPNLVGLPPDISKCKYYPKLNKQNHFDWWFNSPPDKFCEVIYKCISERNKKIINMKTPIVIVDKGLDTFNARIKATLLQKGLTIEESEETIYKYITMFNISNIEDEKLFFSTGETFQDRLKYTNDKLEKGYLNNSDTIYKKYQYLQQRILLEQIEDKYYKIIDVRGTIDNVFQKLKYEIFEIGKNLLGDIKKETTVWGLSGLSECGKSIAGHYISKTHNIWNLKIVYLLKNISKKYFFDLNKLFNNDQLYLSLLVFEELKEFFEKHYYRNSISIESLHNYDLSKGLSMIMKEKYKTIFIDTSLDNRISRTCLMDNNSIKSVIKNIEQKDTQKIGRGLLILKENSDYIIDNNSTVFKFYNRIDRIVINTTKYTGEILQISKLKIPPNYNYQLQTICNLLKKDLANTLLLLMVCGSCYNESIIEGWSDIDLVLVINSYNFKIIQTINQIISTSDINIGTTIFSKREFEYCKLDSKSLYHIYLMQNEKIKPIYYNYKLLIPIINFEDIVYDIRERLPNILHDTKRLLYKENARKIIKNLALILKLILINDKYFPKSYTDIFNMFKINYKMDTFVDINQIIKKYIITKQTDELFIKQSKKIVSYISNKII